MWEVSSERENPDRRLHLLLLQQGAGVWGDRELRLDRSKRKQPTSVTNPKVGFLFLGADAWARDGTGFTRSTGALPSGSPHAPASRAPMWPPCNGGKAKMKVSNSTWAERLAGKIPEALAREIDVFETEIALQKPGQNRRAPVR